MKSEFVQLLTIVWVTRIKDVVVAGESVVFFHMSNDLTRGTDLEVNIENGNIVNRRVTIRMGGTEKEEVGHRQLPGVSPLRTQMVTPFKVSSTSEISLAVQVVANSHSMASFQAVPTSSWGKKYMVITLNHHPSIQILTIEGQKFWINLKCSTPCERFLPQVSSALTNGSNFLVSGQAVTISFCYQNYTGNLTGTTIMGEKPLGVIAGNCLSETYLEECQNYRKRVKAATDGDMATEMFLPYESHGTEFIAITTTKVGMRRTSSINTVLARQAGTKVFIDRTILDLNVTIATAGGTFTYFLVTGESPHRISSSAPVQVFYMQRSPCLSKTGAAAAVWTDDEHGDVALCTLVPNSLFFTSYHWRKKETYTVTYVIIVKYSTTELKLNILKSLGLYIAHWTSVGNGWDVGEMEYSDDDDMYLASTSGNTFGCYVLGLGSNFSYMHPAGFYNATGCLNSTATPSDGTDNDCDGEVDEETEDNQDEDHDSLIDEDTSKKIHGQWSHWKSWHCVNSTHTYRIRECGTPRPQFGGKNCDGSSHEEMFLTECATSIDSFEPVFGYWSDWSEWSCNVMCTGNETVNRHRICKRDESAVGQHCTGLNLDHEDCAICSAENTPCASFQWGQYCERDCNNCMDNCSKHSGECSRCNAGFKYPERACKEACGFNEYGENCERNCFVKCGSDCGERVFGTCLAANRIYYILLIFLLVPAFALYYFLKHKKVVMGRVESTSTSQATSALTTTMTSETLATTMMTQATSSAVDTEITSETT